MSPTEFERHAGMSASKKWRRSIKVDLGDREPSLSLGRWLEQQGFKVSERKDKNGEGKDDKAPRPPGPMMPQHPMGPSAMAMLPMLLGVGAMGPAGVAALGAGMGGMAALDPRMQLPLGMPPPMAMPAPPMELPKMPTPRDDTVRDSSNDSETQHFKLPPSAQAAPSAQTAPSGPAPASGPGPSSTQAPSTGPMPSTPPSAKTAGAAGQPLLSPGGGPADPDVLDAANALELLMKGPGSEGGDGALKLKQENGEAGAGSTPTKAEPRDEGAGPSPRLGPGSAPGPNQEIGPGGVWIPATRVTSGPPRAARSIRSTPSGDEEGDGPGSSGGRPGAGQPARRKRLASRPKAPVYDDEDEGPSGSASESAPQQQGDMSENLLANYTHMQRPGSSRHPHQRMNMNPMQAAQFAAAAAAAGPGGFYAPFMNPFMAPMQAASKQQQQYMAAMAAAAYNPMAFGPMGPMNLMGAPTGSMGRGRGDGSGMMRMYDDGQDGEGDGEGEDMEGHDPMGMMQNAWAGPGGMGMGMGMGKMPKRPYMDQSKAGSGPLSAAAEKYAATAMGLANLQMGMPFGMPGPAFPGMGFYNAPPAHKRARMDMGGNYAPGYGMGEDEGTDEGGYRHEYEQYEEEEGPRFQQVEDDGVPLDDRGAKPVRGTDGKWLRKPPAVDQLHTVPAGKITEVQRMGGGQLEVTLDWGQFGTFNGVLQAAYMGRY